MSNKLSIAPQGDREILFTRSFNAPRAKVWRALTEPELLKQWMGSFGDWTMPLCEVDLRVGGKYRYQWRNGVNGTTMGMGGKFLEVSAPERLVATELFDDPWYPGEATDTQELAEQKGQTTLRLIVAYASREARDGVLAGPMASGMATGYDALDAMLVAMGR